MKKIITFKNGTKKEIKAEQGKYFVLEGDNLVRKSNLEIVSIEKVHETKAEVEAKQKKTKMEKPKPDKKPGKKSTDEIPGGYLDEISEDDKELFGKLPLDFSGTSETETEGKE